MPSLLSADYSVTTLGAPGLIDALLTTHYRLPTTHYRLLTHGRTLLMEVMPLIGEPES